MNHDVCGGKVKEDPDYQTVGRCTKCGEYVKIE